MFPHMISIIVAVVLALIPLFSSAHTFDEVLGSLHGDMTQVATAMAGNRTVDNISQKRHVDLLDFHGCTKEQKDKINNARNAATYIATLVRHHVRTDEEIPHNPSPLRSFAHCLIGLQRLFRRAYESLEEQDHKCLSNDPTTADTD